jgi:hypothetical protein
MSANVITTDNLMSTSRTTITDGGEKVISHMIRDYEEADIITQGSVKQVCWGDVVKCIISAAKEDQINKIKVKDY